MAEASINFGTGVSNAVRTAPSVTSQPRHAMPDDLTGPSHRATAARPQPMDPYYRPGGGRPDYPASTGI